MIYLSCIKARILPYLYSVRCLQRATMLLTILLLNLVFVLASADAKPPPKAGLEHLVNKLEFRLRDMETRMKY